jgi:hypothetical protein
MNRIATDEIDMENSLLLPGYNSANKSDTEDNSFLPDYNSAIDETDTEDSLFLPDYNGCDVMSFRSGMQKVSTFRSAVNNVFAPDSKLAYGIIETPTASSCGILGLALEFQSSPKASSIPPSFSKYPFKFGGSITTARSPIHRD